MLQAGAFATVLNDSGEVLLCHRRDVDLWNPPGGRVEVGESPWDAVIREVREETGLHAQVVRLASVSWKPRRTEILFQFLCRITAGELVLTDECDEFQYFPLDRLPSALSPAFVHRLTEWSKNPSQTVLITDEGTSTRQLMERNELPQR